MVRVVVLASFLAVVASAPVVRADGKKLFKEFRCQSCHAVKSLGIERVPDEKDKDDEDAKNAPDLSAPGQKRTAEWVKRFLLREEVGAAGKKHKKKFRGDPADLDILATWVLTPR